MVSTDSNTKAFFELLRAGLWEREARLSQYIDIDFDAIMRMAEEQSVVGLITAGLEHVKDVKISQPVVLQFVGQALQQEQRNKSMNEFVAQLIKKLRAQDVYALLVKGQGIAQCYERPLWRSSGDVDLLLSNSNYEKAKRFLIPLSSSVETESVHAKHMAMTINSWIVEIHGTLRSCSLKRMDRVIDDVQRDVFYGGNIRSWNNNHIQVFLPSYNNDVFFIFTHIIKHFFHEGIGLRQICDWCRLMWTAKDYLDLKLLEARLKSAGILTEWKAFAALAIDVLGMPIEEMPLYNADKKWHIKAKKIMSFVLMTGNFGHNRDLSYYHKQPLLKQKKQSLVRHTSDAIRRFMIFPKDTMIVWLRMIFGGLKAVIRLQHDY